MNKLNFFPALLDNPRDSDGACEQFQDAKRVVAHCSMQLTREIAAPLLHGCLWKIGVKFPASFSQTNAEVAIRIWLRWLEVGVASRALKHAGAVPRINWSRYIREKELNQGDLGYRILISIQSPNDNIAEHLDAASENVFGNEIRTTREPLHDSTAALEDLCSIFPDGMAQQLFEMMFLRPVEDEDEDEDEDEIEMENEVEVGEM